MYLEAAMGFAGESWYLNSCVGKAQRSSQQLMKTEPISFVVGFVLLDWDLERVFYRHGFSAGGGVTTSCRRIRRPGTGGLSVAGICDFFHKRC